MQTTHLSLRGAVRAPLTFAVVSDLHDEVSDELLSAVRESSPDFILMPGDTTNGRFAESKDTLAFLEHCAAIAPLILSRGNHEREVRKEDVRALVSLGAHWLDDTFFTCKGIAFCGLSSGFRAGKQSSRMRTPPPKIEVIEAFSRLPGYKVLLSHHPEYYDPYIRGCAIDLTLSGHAHGGQWRVFGRGLFAPGQGILPRYTSGICSDGRLVVSRGLGNCVPIPRLLNAPEFLVLHIAPDS